MSDERIASRVADLLKALKPKAKQPVSARVLNTWITQAETQLGDEARGPLTLRRGEVEIVDSPAKIIKPRRFDIVLELRGVTWRRIPFEISADEAGIGAEDETIDAPPLSGFGLPDPDALVGIALRFQIAPKLHAVSDPHEPPVSINDRARDVVDLLLLRDLARDNRRSRTGRHPSRGGRGL